MRRSAPGLRWLLLLMALMAVFVVGGCGDGAADDSGPATEALAPAATATITSTSSVPAGDATSYTFAVCGDNRTSGIEEGVLGRITDSARQRGARFIVNTGDVSLRATPGQLTLYRDFMEGSGLMFFTVAGNHDISFDGTRQDFEGIIGPLYYSFDQGPDHFIVLFNADDEAGISEAQMQWYTSDLEASRNQRNTFIFTHIPVADPGLDSGHVTGEQGSAGLESGKIVVEKAAAQPNVRAFFFGHIHAYLAYKLSGIDAYVTGGAGAPPAVPEGAGGYYHYLLVTVNGTQVEVEVVRV